MCVTGNWTHNLCAANTMLYHWATGTYLYILLSSYQYQPLPLWTNIDLYSSHYKFSVFITIPAIFCITFLNIVSESVVYALINLCVVEGQQSKCSGVKEAIIYTNKIAF